MTRHASDRGQQLLQAIAAHIFVHGYGPTVKELGSDVGLRSTAAVAYHLDVLERAGKITRVAKRARSIRLVAQPDDPLREALKWYLDCLDASRAEDVTAEVRTRLQTILAEAEAAVRKAMGSAAT